MWDVPQFSTQAGNQGQVIQQAMQGQPQQAAQPAATRPVAASSTDMAGNTSATGGALPQQGQPMFRQGSVMGSFFPDAQGAGGQNWGAAISRLMGLGV